MSAKKIALSAVLSTALVGGSGAAVVAAMASTAHADTTTCYTDSNGTTFCNTQVIYRSVSSAQTTVVSVASSDASGKVNLRYQVSTGYKTRAKCYKAASFTRVRKGARCWIATKRGYHFQNSGVDRNGHRHYFDDYIGSRYSPVGTRFYYDAHHRAWRKANCGNFVKFSGRPALKVARVVLVRTFSSIKVTVKTTAQAVEKVSSSASCQTAHTSASATAYGTGNATASAYATASAMTYAKAKSAAQSAASSNAVSNAYAQAYSVATTAMYSSASAMCEETTPSPSPTPTPTPTPTPSPTPPTMTVSNVTSPQEVYNNGETYPNLYADAYTPNGDSITCTIGVFNPNDHSQSGFGSIYGTRSFTFTSNGYDRVGPYTYQAPNDGTGSDVGQYDQLGVTCHDNSNTSVLNASAYSRPFQILAPPAPPA